MFPSIILTAIVFGASQVVANTLPSYQLLKRQSLDDSDIPAQCQSICAPVESTIDTCEDVSCLCTNTVAANLASCVECLVAVAGGTQPAVVQGQAVMDQFSSACDTSSASVTSIQITAVTSVPGGGATSSGAPAAPTGPPSGGNGNGSGNGNAPAPAPSNGGGSPPPAPSAPNNTPSSLPPILSQPKPSNTLTVPPGATSPSVTFQGTGTTSAAALNPTVTNGVSRNSNMFSFGTMVASGFAALLIL